MVDMCGDEIWMVFLLGGYMAVSGVVEKCELLLILIIAVSREQAVVYCSFVKELKPLRWLGPHPAVRCYCCAALLNRNCWLK